MERVEIGLVSIGVLLVVLALRVPIGIALALVAFFGVAIVTNSNVAFGLLSNVPYEFIGDWSLSAVPMFMFMGFLATEMKLTSSLFKAMRIFLAGLPGSLAVSSVAACAMFAAASGSSVATSASMSRIAVPEMLKLGYNPGLATGSIASAGTLGSLIPPSILMVIFGIFAEVSIGKLFAAGVIPGILSAVMFCLMIIIRVKLNPKLAPEMIEKPSAADRMWAMRETWPLPLLVFGVLGGIYIGIFTPTEAGAVGAGLTILIALMQREFSFQRFWNSARQAVEGTASIFIIAVGAGLFARFMALTGVPDFLATSFLTSDSQIILILQLSLMFLLLGCFLDSIGIMLLTLPIILPLLHQADVDLIWFGIILIKLLEIGLVTPPVGLNVFVIKSSLGKLVTLPQIFRGVTWFIFADLITLGLLIAFPLISLWLPSMMQ
ncbi:MAG TPA: C4-dicarboxylate ABC transporter [Rhodospirillaceae bacterium]|nr:C4-dicarboxylate ABC transporter [Rhodospirillaceae bacterium]MAX63171.1 C4-dicarboxylate ABC transporter [Rhodospirillaceae bacterium]MAX65126.1 C4-dicarboxylate ABC transporter [Rhodospirillaceae bacterium]MBB59412.1 C4-dicarboxylate ABC transporter [Rhodospirillaceae bacterium]HAE02746.1 C4-dicarboxylate ABC transporter [Rhodospirillaceae bacterium]|tara:strand:- start:7977 stop:9281 length:1305 start_codon:yes stop_codon:yes gene_type:complete